MKPTLHEALRARRSELGLSQAEVARRSGIQQRQVSLFERGGDVTLSTLQKLVKALDIVLLPLPREEAAKFENLKAENKPAPSARSLLERYRVEDDADESNG